VSRRTSFHFVAALGVTIAAIALTLVVVGAKPAQALPSYKSTCSGCHSATPSGTVTATPSKTTLNPGEAYSVQVTVGLSSSGKAGYWISANDASTPGVSIAGGPGTSPLNANMTAPSAAGTYTYKVWGAKGTPSSGGQAKSTTYQITVSSSGGGGGGTVDTVAPTTRAPSAAKVVKGKKATLKYQVNDAAPNLGTATAVIKIKNRAGKVVKTIKPGSKTVNVLQKATFTCKLAKGTYKFYVTATDAAGNKATNTAVNKLTVK
jgi:hypothetical protein